MFNFQIEEKARPNEEKAKTKANENRNDKNNPWKDQGPRNDSYISDEQYKSPAKEKAISPHLKSLY